MNDPSSSSSYLWPCSSNGQLHPVGIACVAMDGQNRVMGIRAEQMHGLSTSLDAEGNSILLAMTWVSEMGWNYCCFQTDCAVAFSMIMKQDLTAKFKWPELCARMLADKVGWNLMIVRREDNVVADKLAKRVSKYGWSWNDNNSVPRNLMSPE